ncbi:MAG TPA: T9SS type A sorting domain-containing protein [Bacteroidia bacterium]|nr:T9SS type A sorting domain-containing protein [Bacteroidia bacterium]HNU32810.1 T9SS type A sorting domain-containing protein [Bacteroidia bacterium]
MKKISTFMATMLIAGVAFGQSQRLVLVEEFTGETCPPCAAQNPGFDAIMDANTAKGISIKYQNNIPSAGPNFWPYNMADVNARATFLGATGNNSYSPHGYMDGNLFDDVIGNFTASMLNSQYLVTSPFDVTVTHTLSPLEDSVYTHTVVRATQAITGNMSLRVVVVESEIFGYTSPNGEDHYKNVMRKMLPDQNGTSLPATWAVGDSVVVDLAWKIAASTTSYPGPVPAMLRVISFVQDNTSKAIHQTGASQRLVQIDPALLAVTNVPTINCTNPTPTIEIENAGLVTLTSLDIEYKIDANPAQTYNWTGSLAQGASTTVVLPAITVPNGGHTFTVTLTNPNGLTDQVPSNSTTAFSIGGAPVPVSNISQAFTTTTFPPVNWIRENPDNGPTWTRVAAGFNGAGSAKIDYYNSTAGNVDILDILEELNLSNASNASLTFDVAHRQYSAQYSDVLAIDASTDCGQTWNTVWTKSGAALATVTGYLTTAFTPTAAQWRNETVSLNSLLGSAQVLLRIRAVSDYGNNGYVDNVNVTITTGVTDAAIENSLSIFPNPAKDLVSVTAQLNKADDVTITIYDVTGRVIYTNELNNVTTINSKIDVNAFAKGTYILEVSTTEENIVRKIVVE